MPENIYKSAMFENYDTFESEDYISGIIENEFNIQIAEVQTKKKSRDSNGNTTEVELYIKMY